MDGRTDARKLPVIFANFGNKLKNGKRRGTGASVKWKCDKVERAAGNVDRGWKLN
jgi:hypothetical protein